MSKSLTNKQSEILQFIRDFRDQQGYVPSVREIQRSFEYRSPGTVQRFMQILVREGYLSSSEGRARAYSVLRED